MEIDEATAEAHLLLGNIAYLHEWDWPLAAHEFKFALELNPNLAAAHQGYSLFLMDQRKPEEAIAEMELALQLDPLSQPINTSMGYFLFAARRYDEAINPLRRSVDLDPNFQMTINCSRRLWMKWSSLTRRSRSTSRRSPSRPGTRRSSLR